MARLMLPFLAAGCVAAQHITAIPQIRRDLGVIAAIDPNDPTYELCTLANSYLNICVSSLGGVDGLLTAAPTAILDCACCIKGTALSGAFSTCSSYLSAEKLGLTAEIDAYSTLYNLCGQTSCAFTSAAGSAVTATGTKADEETLTTSIRAITSGFASAMPSRITPSASLNMPKACNNMVELYESCSRKDKGFTSMPFKEQASCYCCRGTGESQSWTDELDQYAQTCRDWASSGEPNTLFPVASTFATFCDKFSDACAATAATTATTAAPPIITDAGEPGDRSGDSNNNSDGGGSTVTVTAPGGGSVLHVGYAAVVVAIMGAAVLL